MPDTVCPSPPLPGKQPRDWSPGEKEGYSYLLGQCLGRGHLAEGDTSFALTISCRSKYPDIVGCVKAAAEQFSEHPVSARAAEDKGVILVTSSGKDWPLFFPQHGPGSKLDRKIELVDWQTEIVDEHPKAFLRGLIHSDGSRCMNTFKMKLKDGPKEYSYPRYFFTNYSEDIQAIFCRSCDQLGIRWSRPNWRNISISHRTSVALLDEFVGPKS